MSSSTNTQVMLIRSFYRVFQLGVLRFGFRTYYSIQMVFRFYCTKSCGDATVTGLPFCNAWIHCLLTIRSILSDCDEEVFDGFTAMSCGEDPNSFLRIDDYQWVSNAIPLCKTVCSIEGARLDRLFSDFLTRYMLAHLHSIHSTRCKAI